jgi:hypothetical protein
MSWIFPNEVWPSDAEVDVLDGTVDLHTGLPYIAKGTSPTSSPSYAIQYNRLQQRLKHILAPLRQGMVVREGGLNIGVYPIYFTQSGYHKLFEGATGVAVPDNADMVVYIDGNANLQIANTWPEDVTSYLPLATISTSNGNLSLADRRPFSLFHVPSVSAGSALSRYCLTCNRGNVGNSESDIEIFRFAAQKQMSVEDIQVYCAVTSSSASVDIKAGDVSLLSTPAIPVSGATVRPTIASKTIEAGEHLTVHVTTDGTGSISELSVTGLCSFAMF